MSLFSSLFSSAKKTNLTPSVPYQMPSQASPTQYANLSNLATNYINGVGTGFSPDFVNNATNPVASAMRRNYQNVTAPTISSNYSSRGLGNSSLAANAQGLAEGNVESDIGSLMAQFQTLNEQQKKADTQFGAGLGQNILGQDVGQSNQIAGASERLANATAAQNNYAQQVDRQTAGNLVQAGAQLVNPIGGLLGQLGGGIGGSLGGAMSSLGGGMQTFGSAMNASNSQPTSQLIQALKNYYSPQTNIAGVQ